MEGVQAEDKGKGKKTGKRFEIKKWSAVAMWSWAICTDTCAICRNNLYEPSIEYQANPTGARGGRPGAGLRRGRLPLLACLPPRTPRAQTRGRRLPACLPAACLLACLPPLMPRPPLPGPSLPQATTSTRG